MARAAPRTSRMPSGHTSTLPDALRSVEVDGARVEVDGRALDRGLELQVVRLGVDRGQLRLALEHRRQDRLDEARVESRGHDEEVRDAGDGDVRVRLIDACRDLRGEVEGA